jgi:hypothetical protein
MAVLFRDLAEEGLRALSETAPVSAYRRWTESAGADIASGLAALGWFALSGECERSLSRVALHAEKIRRFHDAAEWRRAIDAGITASTLALGRSGPDVRLYVAVGPARSDASSSVWDGRGLAFIWLENWLGRGATGELQDRDIAMLPSAVSHELAHAFRTSIPATRSALAAIRPRDPEDVWEARLAMPLREAMYEEGLAVRFALEAHPGTSLADQLFMSPGAVQWMEQNWQPLLADRERRWDFDAAHPPFDALVETLFYSPDQSKPPWSIDRPPSKWGISSATSGLRLRAATGYRASPRHRRRRLSLESTSSTR